MRYPKPYFKLDKKGIYLDIEKFYDEIAKYPDGSPLHSISRVESLNMVTTFETILRGFSHSANSHSKVKFWAFRYYPHLRGWEGYNAMKLEQSIKEAWDNEGRAPWSTPTYEYRPEDSNG